jgi:parvulin-like peptidyl-prolyl isomerase
MSTSKRIAGTKLTNTQMEKEMAQIDSLKTQVASGLTLEAAFTQLDIQINPLKYFEILVDRRESVLPVLSKDEADRMDILTQQCLSTYANSIEPLLIFDSKSSTN